MVLPIGPWQEDEKSDLRAYLGFPAIFLSQIPRLEMAIKATNTIADGGSEVSDATQQRMRSVLAQLRIIDCQISQMNQIAFVKAAGTDKTEINPIKAIFLLESRGRKLINQLAIPLGLQNVLRDYYSPMSTDDSAYNIFMLNDR